MSEKLKMSYIPCVEKRKLHVPLISDTIAALKSGLEENFVQFEVSEVDCPDLTEHPFDLASPGLSGSPCLVDVGGVPFLMPIVQKDRYYYLRDLSHLLHREGNSLVIGAGAGPWKQVGHNCEFMPNFLMDNQGEVIINKSRTASVKDGGCVLGNIPKDETGSAVLSNLFVSNGEKGKVFKIGARKRKGEENFISCLRKSLNRCFPSQHVGMGGVFLVKEGKARLHVMPDFSTVPLTTIKMINEWLQFYNMSAPLVCLSFLLSSDPGFDVRVEHTHCFSHHGDGGHYHEDTTPDDVEYLGYFKVCEDLYRVDKPAVTPAIPKE